MPCAGAVSTSLAYKSRRVAPAVSRSASADRPLAATAELVEMVYFAMTTMLNTRQGIIGGLVVALVGAAASGREAWLPTLAAGAAGAGLVVLLAHRYNRRVQGPAN